MNADKGARTKTAASCRASGRPVGARATLTASLAVSVALLPTACSDGGSAPQVVIVIEPPASTELLTGDVLALVSTSSAPTGPLEWDTSDPDVASVDVTGLVEALRPGDVRITAGAPGAVGGTVDLTVVQRPGGYSAEEVDYFAEIAFGAEFGTSSPFLRRWPAEAPPRMRIHGAPTAEDLATLDAVRTEIGALTGLAIDVVEADETVDVHFIPVANFASVLPQAPAGNVGVVWLWWGTDQHLIQSVVLVGSDIDPALRQHIIREEVTQMLGLLRDSFRYPESIFYQSPSLVTEYAPIDRTVIELLYRPELRVGASESVALREARRLLRAETLLAGGDGGVPGSRSAGQVPGAVLGAASAAVASGVAGSAGSSGAPVSSRR